MVIEASLTAQSENFLQLTTNYNLPRLRLIPKLTTHLNKVFSIRRKGGAQHEVVQMSMLRRTVIAKVDKIFDIVV